MDMHAQAQHTHTRTRTRTHTDQTHFAHENIHMNSRKETERRKQTYAGPAVQENVRQFRCGRRPGPTDEQPGRARRLHHGLRLGHRPRWCARISPRSQAHSASLLASTLARTTSCLLHSHACVATLNAQSHTIVLFYGVFCRQIRSVFRWGRGGGGEAACLTPSARQGGPAGGGRSAQATRSV